MIALANAQLRSELERRLGSGDEFERLLDEVVARRLDPASAAKQINGRGGA